MGGGGGGLDFLGDLEIAAEEVVERLHLVRPGRQRVVEAGEIVELGLQPVVAEGFPQDRRGHRPAEVDVEVVHEA